MAKVYDEISPQLQNWLEQQPLYIVATAPLAERGLINASPKGGLGTFKVIDPTTVAYLDLTGSGAETIAHIRENGRIMFMFMSFDKRANIVRLHGLGRYVTPDQAEFASLASRFPDHIGTRSIIVASVTRVSDSCGYAVPLMEYVSERDVLDSWCERKGVDGLVEYRIEKNSRSVEGLPALGR